MSEQLEQIDLTIEEAKFSIGKKTSFDKLRDNEHFKKLILDGYFEEEASRLVLLRADPHMQTEESLSAINKQIDAIGYLRQYFITINQFGVLAERALKDDELTREELLQEELGE